NEVGLIERTPFVMHRPAIERGGDNVEIMRPEDMEFDASPQSRPPEAQNLRHLGQCGIQIPMEEYPAVQRESPIAAGTFSPSGAGYANNRSSAGPSAADQSPVAIRVKG